MRPMREVAAWRRVCVFALQPARAEPEMGFLWKYLLFRAALRAKIMLTTSTCSELIISLANLAYLCC